MWIHFPGIPLGHFLEVITLCAFILLTQHLHHLSSSHNRRLQTATANKLANKSITLALINKSTKPVTKYVNIDIDISI